MNNNSKIEHIFQQNLKDFEQPPSPESWDIIERALHPQDEDRAVPLWLKMAVACSAIAAIFLVGIFVFNQPHKNSKSMTKNNVSAPAKKAHQAGNQPGEKNNSSDTENNSMNYPVRNSSIAKNNDDQIARNKWTNVENNTVINKFIEVQKQLDQNSRNTSILGEKNTQIANHQNFAKSDNLTNPDNIYNTKKIENLDNEVKDDKVSETKIAANHKSEKDLEKEDTSLSAKLKDLEEHKEKTPEKLEKSKNRFRIVANFAPVFAGQGSKMDASNASFGASNGAYDNSLQTSQVFENSLSYGVLAAYELSNKWQLRSGFYLLNLDHKTTYSYNAPNSSNSNYSTLQKLSYFEFPVEILYRLIDKKAKLNTIFGVSGYVLGNNSAYMIAGAQNKQITGGDQLNKFHYSGNFGLGFEYPIFKKVNLNIEPIFKYNFNTFKGQSSSPNPYFLGIYTGFVFKF